MNGAALARWVARVTAARPEEVRALAWSFAYFFCLLAGYYVLRPLRDEMGIAGGVRNLPWLFTATFFVVAWAFSASVFFLNMGAPPFVLKSTVADSHRCEALRASRVTTDSDVRTRKSAGFSRRFFTELERSLTPRRT